MPATLSHFDGERVISLETYRRNGEPVRTPVWFLKEDGLLYVHTDNGTGKVKRIVRNPKVRIAPSHFRGKPKADYIDGRAELETDPKRSRSIACGYTRGMASREPSPSSVNVSQEAKPKT